MYDDDDEFDEDEEGEELATTEADESYTKKGAEDRAFVDEQAKEYDEMKKRKRDELAVLKSRRLGAQSKLAKKERELHQLELEIRKSEYGDTRERVAGERAVLPEGEQAMREEKATREINELAKGNVQSENEIAHDVLLREVRALRSEVDEAARTISLLEHEILRL